MKNKIKIAICGYGNLGKGVESEVSKNPDMELAAVFTRRRPLASLALKSDVPVVHFDDASLWKGKIDVMIMCGGSARDLPLQTPVMASLFNTVDSFDTHAKIPQYKASVDAAARESNNVSIVSVGWDPGLFSIMRLYMGAVLPDGKTYTFWGKGVSQGHSDAVRKIDGVKDAVQYTIPISSATDRIRSGETPEFTAREKHERLCYVVADDNADKNRIENEIKNMPDYFADYNTAVEFISEDELKKNHSRLCHGGNVIHMGTTGDDNKQAMEFSLKLDSNPEFTASILIKYARAAYKLSKKNECGAKTVFDIPPIMLCFDEDEAVKMI